MRIRIIASFATSLALVAALVAAPRSLAASAELTFAPSGLSGGGFVNVVAVDPTGSGLVIAGGDVSGLHRSVDGGRTWQAANLGLTATSQLSVAAVAFAPSVLGLVYAAVGTRGTGGGLLASTDGGRTWSLRSSFPRFSGSNNDGVAGIPHVHPRSTGELLAVDGANGLLYAATFDQGVLRSADGGVTWTSLGLAGRYLRGLAFDPAAPDRLFAAIYGGGVAVTQDARGAGGFTTMPGSPANPEELAVVGDHLYAAAGTAGVYATSISLPGWSKLGGAQIPTGPTWMSIRAYQACGRDVVYAGANLGAEQTIMRSTDGGATWESVTDDPASISYGVGGAGGVTWWLSTQPRMMMAGSFYAAAQIAVSGEPSGQDCLRPGVLVAGRSGVWRSLDAGDSWHPVVQGLGVTIARDVTHDPRTPGRVYVSTADWVFHHSVDGLATVRQKKPPGGTTGADVAVDGAVAAGRVYVATGNPSSNTQGEVYSSANPVSSGWTDEGLSSTGASGKRPLAIAARTVSGQRILIAAVNGSGVWRKAGATWTRVNATAMTAAQPSRGASFAWAPGVPNVFLYDRASGVWRSNDSGRTWTKIWGVASPAPGTGYVSVDPAAPGRLFVSVGGVGVFRIADARAGSVDAGTLVPVEVGAFAAPGPIAHAAVGSVLVTESAAPGVIPALWSTDDDGATWRVISDDVYASAVPFPFSLSIGPGGTVAVSTNGGGAYVGTPSP